MFIQNYTHPESANPQYLEEFDRFFKNNNHNPTELKDESDLFIKTGIIQFWSIYLIIFIN